MGILYAVKTLGKYHFFRTEDLRAKFMETLPEWEQKAAFVYEVRFGKAV